jgi:hypothetical protein
MTEGFQCPTTGIVPKSVINILEIIQICHNYRDNFVSAIGAVKLFIEFDQKFP